MFPPISETTFHSWSNPATGGWSKPARAGTAKETGTEYRVITRCITRSAAAPVAGRGGGQVLRMAPVKLAMNSAANAHARICSTWPPVISHAAAALDGSLVRPQPPGFAWAARVLTGRLTTSPRFSPTLTRWATVHGAPGVVWRPGAAVWLVWVSAPCAPSTIASMHEVAATAARNSSARQGWYP